MFVRGDGDVPIVQQSVQQCGRYVAGNTVWKTLHGISRWMLEEKPDAMADLLLDWIGWRKLFGLFAGLTAASALLIYLIVPEATPAATGAVAVGLRKIYADPRFWRLAPLSASCIGTAWALQGLWAAQWLKEGAQS